MPKGKSTSDGRNASALTGLGSNPLALRFRFLGAMEISDAGRQLILPATRKAQSLLAYLILHRDRSCPRVRLMEMFWGDRPEEKARGSLSTALWHINHCFPDKGYVLSDASSVQFNPDLDLWLDCEQFEKSGSGNAMTALQSALALYRGEFCEGFDDEWVMPERYRFEGLHLDILARLMLAFEDQGRSGEALNMALRLLACDPLREDAHQVAMRVYCRMGQRNAALEQYQRCRETVLSELGAEPMAETRQLHQSILDGQFNPVGDSSRAQSPQPVSLGSWPQSVHDPLNPGVRSLCLGRDAELAFLESAWQRARESEGGLILVDGEAGVGKTRLMEELVGRLRWKGVPVLWGRCYEFERTLPYQPIVEALRSAWPVLPDFHVSDRRTLRGISRLVPEIEEFEPTLQATPPPDQEQSHLFEATVRFLLDMARPAGLVVVLEDLHWAAGSTLELLHYLARHLAGKRVLLLGTFRTEEADPHGPLGALHESLGRDGLVQELHLQHLAEEDVRSLVFALSGRSDDVILPLVRRLYGETEGNPFFLMEVLKSLFESRSLFIEKNTWQGDFGQISTGDFPLPVSINEAILKRFHRLDEDTRRMLSIAAVIGREFDHELLKAAWGKEDEQTLQALDAALRHRLIQESSGVASRDYSFCHHKIREVLYADLSRQRRQQLHIHIGALIEQAFPSKLDEYAGELAYHFTQACRQDDQFARKAIHYLLQVGDRARILYAHQEAVAHYRQALELTEKIGDDEYAARINMKLGIAHHNAFEYEKAQGAFDEGFRFWQQSTLHMDHPVPPPQILRMNWLPVDSIDPYFAWDIPGAVVWQLFSGLLMFSPELEILPDLADRWEIFSGGREYVFHLKKSLQWSDGSPLTAYDFEFSGRRMLSRKTAAPCANLLYDIKGARDFNAGFLHETDDLGLRALDAGTLLIELEKPSPCFLQLLVSFVPVPRRCIEAFGDSWTEPGRLVTHGPFRLESWDHDKSMRLVKAPEFHAGFTGNVIGVELCLAGDPATQLEKFAAGKLDVVDMLLFPTGSCRQAIRQFPEEYFSFPRAMVHFIGFDASRPPFDDQRVRRAFALAIDRNVLAGGIQRNTVFPATGGFVPPALPGHSPGISLPFDPAGARELIAEAGHARGDGFPEVRGVTHLGKDNPVNSYLASQWREVLGIEIEWEAAFPRLPAVAMDGLPNLFVSHWFADYPDPGDFLEENLIRSWTGWQNRTFAGLLEEARNTRDQPGRLRLFGQADRLLVESAAIVPLTYDRQHLLMQPWVKRYPTSPLFTWFWKDVVIAPH